MIDTVLNLLFRCSHQRLTRPLTPVSKAGVPHGDTYVVCLDCGKQFSYDLKEMRIGKPIAPSHESSVLQAAMPIPSRQKVKYALWATVPLGVLLGVAWKTVRPRGPDKAGGGKTGAPPLPPGR